MRKRNKKQNKIKNNKNNKKTNCFNSMSYSANISRLNPKPNPNLVSFLVRYGHSTMLKTSFIISGARFNLNLFE